MNRSGTLMPDAAAYDRLKVSLRVVLTDEPAVTTPHSPTHTPRSTASSGASAVKKSKSYE